MAQISLTFESVFPTFTGGKKILTDYKIPDAYIVENDYNVLVGLAKGYLLKSTVVEQVYATASVLGGAYYQNYLTKKEFYTRTINDLTNLEQKVTQALYQVAQDSSVKFGDVIDETKLKGYLAALSTNTNTSDLQYLQQITALKDYYNSLNSDSPALDMFQAFLKNLLLNLQENNGNNFPILYITGKNENNKNTNLLASVDMNNKQINQVGDASSDNDAPNGKQTKQYADDVSRGLQNQDTLLPKNAPKIDLSVSQVTVPTPTFDEQVANKKYVDTHGGGDTLGMENSGQLQPKKAQLISVLDQRIASVLDPINPQDAATKDYVDNHSGAGLGQNITLQTGKAVILKTPVDIDIDGKKIVNLAEPSDIHDASTKDYVDASVAPFNPLKSAFHTKVENGQIEQIANIKSNSKVCDFIVTTNELVLRDVPKPRQAIDFTTSTTGLYNAEINNKLHLTGTSYNFIGNLEIHNQNKEDFIHIGPNTTIQHYHANGVPIDQKGGSFIILPVNGVFRIKSESASNPTKRVIQAHFGYYQNYQIMLVFSDGSVEFVPNLLKEKQIIIKQNNLIYEVQ